MLTGRITIAGFAISTIALLLMTYGIQDTEASNMPNGLLQKCGNDARDFLRWFCHDPTFQFPFPFHRIYIILRYRAPVKGLYPFQHQASQCCRHGCDETGYSKMCHYHRRMKLCGKFRTLNIQHGTRKRQFSFCLLKH